MAGKRRRSTFSRKSSQGAKEKKQKVDDKRRGEKEKESESKMNANVDSSFDGKAAETEKVAQEVVHRSDHGDNGENTTRRPVGSEKKLEKIDSRQLEGSSRRAQEAAKLLATGLEPELILGAVIVSGDLFFLLKWKGSDESDLIPSKDLRYQYPQLVIRYYESRLRF